MKQPISAVVDLITRFEGSFRMTEQRRHVNSWHTKTTQKPT